MITTVDIGASKTLLAQFDHAGKIKTNLRFETPKNQDEFYDELSSTLKKLTNIDTICVGAPGIIDPLGVIRRCGVLPWEDFDLKGRLASDLNRPVFIENDAKLAGLGEANALKPVPNLCLYLTISTGIGEGVVENGKLVQALKYSEAGHMIIWDDTEWRVWQNVASGKAIKKHFGKLAKELTNPADWQWVASKIALGLQAIIPTLQPDVVIIGGGVGHYFDSFGADLSEILDKRLPKFIKRPKFIGAKHPDEAVIYGCYYYTTHQQNR